MYQILFDACFQVQTVNGLNFSNFSSHSRQCTATGDVIDDARGDNGFVVFDLIAYAKKDDCLSADFVADICVDANGSDDINGMVLLGNVFITCLLTSNNTIIWLTAASNATNCRFSTTRTYQSFSWRRRFGCWCQVKT